MTSDDGGRMARPPAHLVAHLGEIVSVVAADGTVLSVNQPPSERVSLGPPGNALGWVHPEDLHVVQAAFRTLLEDPSAQTRTLVRVRRHEGPYRHMETTGINRLDDPDVGGLVFVARDVEDSVRLARTAERSLQAQRLVADLGVRLLVQPDVDAELDAALARTLVLLDADHLTLLERDPDGALRVTRSHGDRPATAVGPAPAGDDLDEQGQSAVVSSAEARLEGPDGAVGLLVAGWAREDACDDVARQLLQGVANVLAGARARQRRETAAVVRALHDPLTGLPTRSLLLDRLDHALARARREGSDVAVLLVDLDRFKEVNDRFGHSAGDAVLADLGGRLAASVRPGDTAARLGGDEFVVLCEDVTDAEVVVDLVARLRGAFTVPYEVPGVGGLVLSGSIGAASSAEHGHDRAALLEAADAAMYRDKRRRSA